MTRYLGEPARTRPPPMFGETPEDRRLFAKWANEVLEYIETALWPVGTAGQVLTYDATQPNAVKWAAAGAGGGDNLTVNGVAVVDADLDDATPAAPAGSVNVKWQKDAASPANVSAYLLGSAVLDNAARVTVRTNTGADVGTRRRLNLIEGTNITLTVADDAGSEEVDVTIAAAAGGGGPSLGLVVALDMATGLL